MADNSSRVDGQLQRKTTNRRRVLKGLGATGILGLAGCAGGSGDSNESNGGSEDTGGTTGSNGNSDAITVEYWMYFGGGDADEMNALIEKFNKNHDDIQIDRQRVPFDQMIDKLYTAVSSGNAPDLASMFMGYAGVMEPLVTPINDYIQESTRSAYHDVAWEGASLDGNIYALPIDVHGHALYANESILEKAGVSTPFTSFEEFKSACEAIKEKTDARPFSIDDDMGPTDFSRDFFMGVQQNGSQLLSDDFRNVAFNNEAGKRTLDFFSNITGEYGWDIKSTTEDGSRTKAFRNGDLAMMIGGNWDINNFQNESGEIIDELQDLSFTQPFFFPGKTRDMTFIESNSLYVPKKESRSDEKTKAAVRAAEWITQNNPSWGYDAGHIPSAVEVAQSDEVQNSELWQKYGTLSTLWDMVSQGKASYMPQAKIQMLSGSLWGWIGDTYGQNITPDKALEKGANTVQSALDDAYN